jgi:hypothetical protein
MHHHSDFARLIGNERSRVVELALHGGKITECGSEEKIVDLGGQGVPAIARRLRRRQANGCNACHGSWLAGARYAFLRSLACFLRFSGWAARGEFVWAWRTPFSRLRPPLRQRRSL